MSCEDRLPLAPLQKECQRQGVSLKTIARWAGMHWSSISAEASRHEGTITTTMADRAAIRGLHMHPIEIWGTDWLTWEAQRDWQTNTHRRTPTTNQKEH